MESRRIVLLTEGFLRGWLDFDYKTATSQLREEYIINMVERSLLRDQRQTRLGIVKTLGQNASNRQAIITALTDMEEDVNALTLPYLAEKSKIKNNTKNVDAVNDLGFWSKLLTAENKKLTKK